MNRLLYLLIGLLGGLSLAVECIAAAVACARGAWWLAAAALLVAAATAAILRHERRAWLARAAEDAVILHRLRNRAPAPAPETGRQIALGLRARFHSNRRAA